MAIHGVPAGKPETPKISALRCSPGPHLPYSEPQTPPAATTTPATWWKLNSQAPPQTRSITTSSRGARCSVFSKSHRWFSLGGNLGKLQSEPIHPGQPSSSGSRPKGQDPESVAGHGWARGSLPFCWHTGSPPKPRGQQRARKTLVPAGTWSCWLEPSHEFSWRRNNTFYDSWSQFEWVSPTPCSQRNTAL